MRIEADRMRNLQLTESDVATERDVVLEERSSRIDSDPGALFQEQMQAALFLNHPYGIPIIGWRHEIEGLSREDALAFYRTYYAPNNAILVIAGDVEPERVKALAETYYGPIAPTPGLVERVRPSEPPHLVERRLSMVDATVEQPYLSRTYLAPERNSGAQRDAAALTVLAELLGGSGTTSVLARALTQGDAKAVYAGAYYDGDTLDIGSSTFVVIPLPGVSLDEAEAAMDAALETFLADGVDIEALERIKTQVRASEIYGRDNVEGLASAYGNALTLGLSIKDVQAWPSVLQAVTPEDVMAAARKVLDRRSAVTGHLSTIEEAP
jgi:zinc protease